MTPHQMLQALLAQVGTQIPAHEHPAHDLPTFDGSILPAAVLALQAPRDFRRMAGRRSNGIATATIHAVGATRTDCLDAAARVRDALDGYRLTPNAGTASEDSYSNLEPAVNPNADPRRFEVPLVFNFPL